jgi:outer membrane protein OmpA-like peptidoglycan-associated protein
MAEQGGGGGRPGPALTIGVPLIILAAGGYFAYAKLIKPALDEKDRKIADEKIEASTSVSGKKHGKLIKVAGDPWSGYSTFRSEPRLAAELAKGDVGLEYIDDDKLYEQGARMQALAEGKIDIALTTLDAFLQHGAKHKGKDGLYPGVILWNIDESNGGDAIFLARDRQSFDDVKTSDKVCFSTGTPSEHLWDFASLSFSNLGDSLGADNGVVAKDCWEKLKGGQVQADDVIVDIVVAGRDYVIKEKETLGKLARAYFKVIDGYGRDKSEHAKFITADCGADCGGDAGLGTAVLEGIDFLTYEENMCLWWGQCGSPAKMIERIGKTGRLLSAKGKVTAADLPQATTILNDSFLVAMKKDMEDKARLAAEVAGKDTKAVEAIRKVEEKRYDYAAESAKADRSADVGTLNLPNIYFQEGSYLLDQNAKSIVVTIADKLQSFPALCVKVYGHTNSLGSPAANKALSEQRANAIVTQLKALDGIAFPASRFDARGFGSEQPIRKDGKEDRDASRRTEFKLFNCGAKAT